MAPRSGKGESRLQPPIRKLFKAARTALELLAAGELEALIVGEPEAGSRSWTRSALFAAEARFADLALETRATAATGRTAARMPTEAIAETDIIESSGLRSARSLNLSGLIKGDHGERDNAAG